ncbi:MAG TPA: DnaA/Hda family protein [Chlamydiales bacterium]|nr:DnaA/Hda family protein [Chlamydiales bacterium]
MDDKNKVGSILYAGHCEKIDLLPRVRRFMQIWDQFLSQLESELGRDTVDRWIRPIKLLRFDAANIFLEASDSFQMSFFEEHVRPFCKKLINNNSRPIQVKLSLKAIDSPVYRNNLKNREFDKKAALVFASGASDHCLWQGASEEQKNAAKPTSSKTDSSGCFGIKQSDPIIPAHVAIAPDPIDPEMTLKNFFLSSHSNKIACNLISEIATCPFNPLLLYGPSGSGKTHLLMAAADILSQTGKTVFYIRASTFTEHIVQAIRTGSMQEVRKIYRSTHTLIVDDIHLFCKKSATQEEFFHTFNDLHTRGCNIILSSSSLPAKLSDIEPRLISRFEWGISVGLEKENPTAILKKKAEIWGLNIDEKLIPFLIETFPSSALLALHTLALRAKHAASITPGMASVLLKDLLEKEAQFACTPEKIIKATASYYGIRAADILSKSQERDAAHSRQVAMYFCREKLKLPYQKIGEIFARDHSTVISSIRQVTEKLEKQKPEICETIASIKNQL